MTAENQQTLQLSLPIEALEQTVKWDAAGLVPAIVQDARSKEVLMLAYMNRESLRKSVETGQTWFWSRSRAELWNKGATSGNTQQITALKYDCDGDTLLVEVIANGPACHTGEPTCFYRTAAAAAAAATSTGSGSGADERFKVLAELEQLIAERYTERPEGAYTTYLFEKGLDKILKKVGEETAESIIAAKNGDNDELRYEVSDLIYHLLVLLRERNLPLDEIMQELERRHERPRRD
ncbi:bifunctional phosphoribosyl-AMP cyclohydrolase/phosphoribosyl-ATP diphosphatase HisIE [Paenibacillus sp. p3-SID1389]|uniref:bifunctional phosphoribosyl-AMP cyclohydrolase/phosphoribosyl-ATP diphosphatase HisIE n=1 Tax=Paenibacillus sp. p3-SID1389 TaxID=2916364 RepID=UPI0021A64985|nr:bifunctional phosphoribosyl-AMP cyclohydrolase/phosphoribosyl-ATP diphosphatase HisIE [Paenibacillus sp. p3-SID1389]MCT2196647.1 bifunctional phosphoribosyl-AMP cyclohydrolase/phosphoribosyl-ATP diphosphatase HisIE [Paenibacillus sp. p3-SID1389]